MIKTRFAPSPTGNLHIGGARTAIFNYLYAKSMGGEFHLRIEDTDLERSTKEYEEEIIHSMKWLSMDYDGDLVYQSKRFDIYKKFVQKLLDSGNAYYCSYSGQDLDRLKNEAGGKLALATRKCREENHTSGAVRFKVPNEDVVFTDELLGEIKISSDQIEDFVIMRASGAPTYNLTVVIDDAEMGITDVIRGDDHINNTPKQILLYRALGLDIPRFMHVPMILGPDKKKLSKRHGATAVSQYKEMGYLPEAILNYLVRLSWSYGDSEILSREELIKIFKDGQFSKSAAVLSTEKLDWLNAHYIKNLSIDDFIDKLIGAGFVSQDLKSQLIQEPVFSFLKEIKERTKKLNEFWDMVKFIFKDKLDYDDALIAKHLKDEIKPILADFVVGLQNINFSNKEDLEKLFGEISEKYQIKMRKFAPAIRVLLTNRTATPGIFEVMQVLGKYKVVERLNLGIS